MNVIELISFEGVPQFETALPAGGYVLLAVYVLVTLALLVWSIGRFVDISWRQALVILGLVVAGFAAGQALTIPPQSTTGFAPPDLVLFAALPMTLAALFYGPGPALIVGLATGLSRAGWDTGRLAQPFEFGLWAAVVGLLLYQPYRGWVARWMRQPVIAVPLAAVAVVWPLSLMAIGASGSPSEFVGLERILVLARPLLGIYAVEGFIAGLVAQLVMLSVPDAHPVRNLRLISPPWERRLSRRWLFTLTPFVGVAIVALVGGVAFTAYQVARTIVVNQMVRNAAIASDEIPFFVQVGRSLMVNLASDESMLSASRVTRQASMDEGLQALPFFYEMLYLDVEGEVANSYPNAEDEVSLSHIETGLVALALEGGVPAEDITFDNEGAGLPVYISFVVPVSEPVTGEARGVLVGRTSLEANPLMQPVVSVLGNVVGTSGEGFLIDETNTILLYPAHPEHEREVFSLNGAQISRDAAQGVVYRQTTANGTQQLVYVESITGQSDWSVVVIVPNQVVLALATQIALPTLILLLLLVALGVPLVVTLATRITVPLETLAQAADDIAAGEFERPVKLAGEDEVGRLGLAFEDMRRNLKARLEEQETLLRVSYAVASSLELERFMAPILQGALDSGGANGVRAILQTDGGQRQVFKIGPGADGMAPMDDELLNHAENQGTLVVRSIERARATLRSSLDAPQVRAMVAVPLRSDTTFHGILWVAYDREHAFDQSELTFLSNLAGQASLAIANARLFEAAEGGRRRLAAILSSSSDAVLVTNSENRLLLTNPAAEAIFALDADEARGKPLDEVIQQADVRALFDSLEQEPDAVEIPLEDGRTLLAKATAAVSTDGRTQGRVVTLSDITYLKERDEMRIAFVHTVSHDLRVPLTFMNGYVTMMTMVGDLNEKQQEFMKKIEGGIKQMADLIEKLLNLGRIEAGVALMLEACDVKVMLQEVHDRLAEYAKAQDVKLELKLPDTLPHIVADTTLYRQAVLNLLQNGIKYTPSNGQVVMSAEADKQKVTVRIKDTGPGISEEDQKLLFDAFYRSKDKRTSKIQGAGLGLALVKGTAERHNGRVYVHSKLGEGSTFVMEMPLRQPEKPDSAK